MMAAASTGRPEGPGWPDNIACCVVRDGSGPSSDLTAGASGNAWLVPVAAAQLSANAAWEATGIGDMAGNATGDAAGAAALDTAVPPCIYTMHSLTAMCIRSTTFSPMCSAIATGLLFSG